MILSASLVLYHNDPKIYEQAICSFLEGIEHAELVVVDHSDSPLQSDWFSHERVKYIYANRNAGFGAGHNMAFNARSSPSDVHLFLNPDVRFGKDVLPYLLACFAADGNIGAMMPKILYESGDIQHLVKLLPTPVDLIFRRFIPLKWIRKRINDRYELRGLSHTSGLDAPTLSGCFLLVRSHSFAEIGGFDERYFMYMEDVDLVRRLGHLSRTRYEPAVFVTHGYAKGSYTNKKLLGYHIKSAWMYFSKWGWMMDSVRRSRNRKAIEVVYVDRKTKGGTSSKK
jgi:GT2 family glycosyltransferase